MIKNEFQQRVEYFQRDLPSAKPPNPVESNIIKTCSDKLRQIPDSFTYQHLSALEHRIYAYKQSSSSPNQKSLVEIYELILRLKQGLFEQINCKSDFLREFNKITDMFEARASTLNDVESLIQNIKNQVLRFDINRFISEIEHSQDVSFKINKKNGIIFLGLTGVGKTTTMLSFLGHQLVKSREHPDWLVPKSRLNSDPDIQNLVTHPGSRSVTKNITAVQLPIDMRRTIYDDQYLVDTPGFQDTQGELISLVNAYVSSVAIRALKSTRFVVVLSGADSGSRQQGTKKIIQILNKIFPKYDEIKNSLTYIFNRYSKETLRSMHVVLNDLLKEDLMKNLALDSSQKENIRKVVSHLISTCNRKSTQVFNPQAKDRQYAIDFVDDVLDKNQYENIGGNIFPIHLSEDTQTLIKTQLHRHEQLIDRYLKLGKVHAAVHLFGQICELRSILNQGGKIPQKLSNKFQIYQKKIRLSFNEYSNLLIKKLNGDIGADDVKKFNLSLERLQKISESSPRDQIKVVMEQTLEKVKSKLEDKIGKQINDFSTKYYLKTVQEVKYLLILLSGLDRNDVIRELRKFIQNQRKNKEQQYQGLIKKGSFQDSIALYNRYVQIKRILNTFDGNDQNNEFIWLNKALISEIVIQKNSIKTYIENISQCQKHSLQMIERVSSFMLKLEQCRQFLDLIDNKEQVYRQIVQFRNAIEASVQSSLSNIIEYLNNGIARFDSQKRRYVTKTYANKDFLKRIPQISVLIEERFSQIDKIVVGCLTEDIIKFENNLENIVNKRSIKSIIEGNIQEEIIELDVKAIKIQKVLSLLNRQENGFDKQDVQKKFNKFLDKIIENLKEIQKRSLDKQFSLSISTLFEQIFHFVKTSLKVACLFPKMERYARPESETKKIQSSILNNEQLLKRIETITKIIGQIYSKCILKIEEVLKKISVSITDLSSPIYRFDEFLLEEVNCCKIIIKQNEDIFLTNHEFSESVLKFHHQIRQFGKGINQSLETLIEIIGNPGQNVDLEKSQLRKIVQSMNERIMFESALRERPQANQTMQPTRNSQRVQIPSVIGEFAEKYVEWFNTSKNNRSIKIEKLQIFANKCNKLSLLNIGNVGQNFKSLETEAKQIINKTVQTRIQVFQRCLVQEEFQFDSQSIVEKLEDFSKDTLQLYHQAEALFAEKIYSLTRLHQNRNPYRDQRSVILVQLILKYSLFDEIASSLKRSVLLNNKDTIQKVIASLEKSSENLKVHILRAYKNLLVEAHENLNFKLMTKVKNQTKILKQVEEKLNLQKKSQKIRKDQQMFLNDLNQRYVEGNDDLNFEMLQRDYYLVSQEIEHEKNGQFERLMQSIIHKVGSKLQNIRIQLSHKPRMQELEMMELQLNKIPFNLREHVQWINVHQLLKSKQKTLDDHRIALNNDFDACNIFVDHQFNKEIISLFKAEQISQNKKIGLLNKIEIQLIQMVNSHSNKNLFDYSNCIFKCWSLRFPEQADNHAETKKIAQVYKNTYSMICQKIYALVEDEIKIQRQTLNHLNSINADEIIKNYDKFICDLITFTQLVGQGGFEIISNKLYEKLPNLISEHLCDYLLKHKLQVLYELEHVKIVSNVYQKEEKISQNVTRLLKFRVIDSIINIPHLKFKDSDANQILAVLIRKPSRSKQELKLMKTLHDDIEEIKKQLEKKHQKIINFKLVENPEIQSMDQSEIEKQIVQIFDYNSYFVQYLKSLFFALGIANPENKLSKLEKFWVLFDQQVKNIHQQIVQFSNYPNLTQKQLEKVKKQVDIINICGKFMAEFCNVKRKFNADIETHHKNFSNQLIKLLARLENESKIFQNQQQTTRTQGDKLKRDKIQIQKNNEKQKLQKLQKDYEDKMAVEQPANKADLQNAFEAEKCSLKNITKEAISKIDRQNELSLVSAKKAFDTAQQKDLVRVAEDLEKMACITYNLMLEDKQFIRRNDQVVNQVKRIGNMKWLAYLFKALKDIDSPTAGRLCLENNHLKKIQESKFSKNIAQISLSDAVEHIMRENSYLKEQLTSQELISSYNSCNAEYEDWRKSYQFSSESRPNLIKTLLSHRPSSKDTYSQNIKLLGQIFALWTILNSYEQQRQIVFNYKPHILQILTIILLIRTKTGKKKTDSLLQNRFAEIQTGEGKSLILAVTAVYLVLKGFEVDCVCYSEYLSKRDKQNFNQLFAVLEMQNRVNYCTFNDLIEKVLNYNKVSFREESLKLLSKNNNKNQSSKKQTISTKLKNRILLMDEADVFFIDEFYGDTYAPAVEFKSSIIKTLYQLIWRLKDQKHRDLKASILSSKQLNNFIDKFPQLKQVVLSQIDYMIDGAKNYVHEYQVINGKISYKSQDGYSDKISYGYKTIFAHFYEYERNIIKQLPDVTNSLEISLGKLSYAQLPKMYETILGVTGTLKELSQTKKQIMATQYQIRESIIIPSVYQNVVRKDKGYLIVDSEQHYDRIAHFINKESAIKRPIMVFFESFKELDTFFKSEVFKCHQKNTVVINQKLDDSERKIRIMRAMNQGKISLITKAFSRGTDFVIYEEKVVICGGALLIVTYIPDEKSEEVQVLGRVARQGDPGQSILIIKKEELSKKFNLNILSENKDKTKFIDESKKETQVSFSKPADVANLFNKQRQKATNFKYQIIKKQIQKCKESHDQTIRLYESVLRNQFKDALERICQLNTFPTLYLDSPIKTVLAVDATNSMNDTLNEIKNSLAGCFKRVYEILRVKKIQYGFQIKIAVYRNYDLQEDQLLELTPFETKPDQLVKFIKEVEPKGGWIREALEVVFDHCLKIDDLKQIIVITDAEANTQEGISHKRSNEVDGLGLKYWSGTKRFSKELDSASLLTQVRRRGVIIHSLPIGETIFEYYQEMSSGGQVGPAGKCQRFNPKTKGATEHLTNFISLSILEQMEGISKGNQLVVEYKKKYKV